MRLSSFVIIRGFNFMETILHIYIIIFILNIRGLIFKMCQKSAKTAKYNSLENFQLYGRHSNVAFNIQRLKVCLNPIDLFMHYWTHTCTHAHIYAYTHNLKTKAVPRNQLYVSLWLALNHYCNSMAIYGNLTQ